MWRSRASVTDPPTIRRIERAESAIDEVTAHVVGSQGSSERLRVRFARVGEGVGLRGCCWSWSRAWGRLVEWGRRLGERGGPRAWVSRKKRGRWV